MKSRLAFVSLFVGATLLAASLSLPSGKSTFGVQALAAGDPPQSSTDQSAWAVRLIAIATKLQMAAYDTPPYRLQARVRVLDFRHKLVEGNLVYTWISPERWRMETTWGGATRVKIVNRDRWWRSPANADVVAEQHTEERLGFPQFLKPQPNAWFVSPRRRSLDGVSADCITEKWRMLLPGLPPGRPREREICINASNDLPLRVVSGKVEIRFGSGEYVALGLRRFPQKFNVAESGRTVMELTLASLEALTDVPANTFAPPAGAISFSWCPGETRPLPVSLPARLDAPPNAGKLEVTLAGEPRFWVDMTPDFSFVIFDVDAGGEVKGVQAFSKNGEDASQKPGAKKLRDSKFKPAVCGTGQAIENELVWISPPQ